jgi:Zn-dependent M28 family amino/carboxypeptidase
MTTFEWREPNRARGASGSAMEREARLERDVVALAETLGERNLRDAKRRGALIDAREHIVSALGSAGHTVRRQPYFASGEAVQNVEVECRGSDLAQEIVVFGAHYDTAAKTPGANDNASGVATLLEIARNVGALRLRRTVRLVAFCTEEPPFTRTKEMGSLVHAQAARQRGDHIVGMLSLEMLGCFARDGRARHAPFPLNWVSPWRPDFVAVIGNLRSHALVADVARELHDPEHMRSKSLALPGLLPGVRSSDQWSYWKVGYPAAMITDTAWLRYRHYHRVTDTPEKLDYARMGHVTAGILRALDRLAAR